MFGRATIRLGIGPHSSSYLVDPFAEIGITLLINIISVQKFNCLSF